MPSRDEIEAAKTPKGGWTKATLAGWGVPWPPPKGWKDRLIEAHEASESHEDGSHEDAEPDLDANAERLSQLRLRLNEAYLETRQGDYFRARVHGWLAYRLDADVKMPVSLAERLTSPFDFDPASGGYDASTVDAFVIAYHAAESLTRHLLATLDGSGPEGVPLVALKEVPAGKTYYDRLRTLSGLPDLELTRTLDFVFLPAELQQGWAEEESPTLEDVRQYLRAWVRHLAHYTVEWSNAYNAAKHGLTVGSRPAQMMLLAEGEADSRPLTLMDGPVLRTVETERVSDEKGNPIKLPNGKRALRWFWMYRAVDPEELIAQTIVTADLFDWMGAISRARITGKGQPVKIRSEPKPRDIQRRTAPGRSVRMDIAALPLPPAQAEAIVSRLGDDGPSEPI